MFDLDGTLIHSMPGIVKSLRLMMEEMHLPPRDDAYMHNLIGPPFQIGFPNFLDLHGADIDRAISIYMRYAESILDEEGMISPFPGVLDMLKALNSAGAFVGVVTSKGVSPANEQIDRFGFRPYLSYLQTADDNGNGEKTELLRKACFDLGEDDLVMVGDRFYDLDAAHACHVDSIGVLYGYATNEEIYGCHPTHIVGSVKELQTLLLNI